MVENTARFGGGAIYLWGSNGYIINNTISRNFCHSSSGGGLYCGSSTILINNILWADSAQEGYEISGTPSITYSNIGDSLWPGEGNISADPLFRDPLNGDYHLMSTACGDPSDSPCIDAGDPSIFDYLLDCNWGLGEMRSDMGAYGGQAIPTGIRDENPPSIPMACGLFQNYPNPFNATTTLSYTLPEAGAVTISIFNVIGQRVATIFEGDQQAGRHTITWDASGFPSGVYFARLEAGEYSKSVKMVLLK